MQLGTHLNFPSLFQYPQLLQLLFMPEGAADCSHWDVMDYLNERSVPFYNMCGTVTVKNKFLMIFCTQKFIKSKNIHSMSLYHHFRVLLHVHTMFGLYFKWMGPLSFYNGSTYVDACKIFSLYWTWSPSRAAGTEPLCFL